jgi:hypothetical protein
MAASKPKAGKADATDEEFAQQEMPSKLRKMNEKDEFEQYKKNLTLD